MVVRYNFWDVFSSHRNIHHITTYVRTLLQALTNYILCLGHFKLVISCSEKNSN